MGSDAQYMYDTGMTEEFGGTPDFSNSYDDGDTSQTCKQKHSPTKKDGVWYDANGHRINDTDAYFAEVEKNGRYWENCK